MRLLSHNVHQNQVSIFYDSNKKKYYKIASTPNAIFDLKQEKQGWDWYTQNISSQTKLSNCILEKDSYYKLEIEELRGEKINYQNSFENNFQYIEKVVDWYLENWPKQGKIHPIHGDLTLDNILFYEDKQIHIIDWECFNKIETFWGYDILYLILSSVFLPSKKIVVPNKNELKLIGQLFVKLLDNGISNRILETPLFTLHYSIKTKLKQRYKNISEDKFFPLWASELERDIVDESLVRAYRYAVYNRYLENLKKNV